MSHQGFNSQKQRNQAQRLCSAALGGLGEPSGSSRVQLGPFFLPQEKWEPPDPLNPAPGGIEAGAAWSGPRDFHPRGQWVHSPPQSCFSRRKPGPVTQAGQEGRSRHQDTFCSRAGKTTAERREALLHRGSPLDPPRSRCSPIPHQPGERCSRVPHKIESPPPETRTWKPGSAEAHSLLTPTALSSWLMPLLKSKHLCNFSYQKKGGKGAKSEPWAHVGRPPVVPARGETPSPRAHTQHMLFSPSLGSHLKQ